MALEAIGDIADSGLLSFETVSWSTQSDWDAYRTSDGIIHPSGTLELTEWLDYWDDLADGDSLPSVWTVNGSAVIDNNRALSNGLSVYTGGNSATEAFVQSGYNISSDTLHVRVATNETSNQSGYAWGLTDSNDNVIVECGGTNPDLGIYDGNGSHCIDSGGYGNWYIWDLYNFDFTNYQFDFDLYQGDVGGTPNHTSTDRPFATNAAVDKIWCGGAKTGGSYCGANTGSASDMWWDNVWGVLYNGEYISENKSFSKSVKPDISDMTYTLNGAAVDAIVSAKDATINPVTEDFESGTLDSAWTVNEGDFGIKTDRVYAGTYSAGIEDNSPNNLWADWEPSELDSDGEPITVWGYYNESSNSTGASLQLYDASNNYVVGWGTDNPQWVVEGSGGVNQIYSGDGTGRWVYTEANIDWSDRTVTVTFTDQNSGTSKSTTVNIISDAADRVSRVRVGGELQESADPHAYHWWDNLHFEGQFEQNSVTLDGSTSYTLSWSNSYADYWVEFDGQADSRNGSAFTVSDITLQE